MVRATATVRRTPPPLELPDYGGGVLRTSPLPNYPAEMRLGTPPPPHLPKAVNPPEDSGGSGGLMFKVLFLAVTMATGKLYLAGAGRGSEAGCRWSLYGILPAGMVWVVLALESMMLFGWAFEGVVSQSEGCDHEDHHHYACGLIEEVRRAGAAEQGLAIVAAEDGPDIGAFARTAAGWISLIGRIQGHEVLEARHA